MDPFSMAGSRLHDDTIQITTGLDDIIPWAFINPNGADKAFQDGHPKTVFCLEGHKVTPGKQMPEQVDEATSYVFDDHLEDNVGLDNFQQIFKELRESSKHAGQPRATQTARFYQSLLRILLDDPTIELLHILAGVNLRQGGYAYRAFGYRSSKSEEKPLEDKAPTEVVLETEVSSNV